MNDLQVFESNEFGKLEVLTIGDKYYFPAIACANILGYTNPRKAIIDHCKTDGVTKRDGVSLTTNQHGITTEQRVEIKYISEGNLYRLIVRSKLPKAQEFESWVFDNILPTIRKYGVYATPEMLEKFMHDPKCIGDVFYALAAEQDKNKRLTEENRRLTSKANYCDMILANPDAVPVTLIAKDYGKSAMVFNAMLNDFGIQYRVGGTWELYQEYAGNGYTHGNVHYSKGGHMKMHMCWTQKGRLFLYEFLKQRNIIPMIERLSNEG